MDRKQYDKMERFIPQFKQAESNFVRMSRSDLNEVREMYNDITGKHLAASNMNCTHCVIKMMKEMGALMKRYEEWREKISGPDWKDKDTKKKPAESEEIVDQSTEEK